MVSERVTKFISEILCVSRMVGNSTSLLVPPYFDGSNYFECKDKSVTLSVVKEKDKEQDVVDYTLEEFAFLINRFENLLKKRKLLSSSQNLTKENTYRFERYLCSLPSLIKDDKLKCFECCGMGHRTADCGNKKKCNKAHKSTTTTCCCDNESETMSECEGEETIAFVEIIPLVESTNEDDSKETPVENYFEPDEDESVRFFSKCNLVNLDTIINPENMSAFHIPTVQNSRHTPISTPEDRSVALCNVALNAIYVHWTDTWYIDNGSSKNMTGVKSCFTSMFDKFIVGSFTFGDGARDKIIGCCGLNISGLPNLMCVLLVEGLEVILIGVSQLIDEYDGVLVNRSKCIEFYVMSKSIMGVPRSKDTFYCVLANEKFNPQVGRSMSKENSLELWYKCICHLNHCDLVKLSKRGSVKGLPRVMEIPLGMCKRCKQGKQIRSTHLVLNSNSITHILELLHMNLIGPNQTEILGCFKYILLCVNEYSMFTWDKHLKRKFETLINFRKLCKKISTEKICEDVRVVGIMTDHGTEFENSSFERFCDKYGIHHEFSSPITPQQNGVVERKNMVLIELSRSMINNADLPHSFLGEVVQTSCCILYRVVFRPRSHKTSYGIWNGKKPYIAHLNVFGSPCLIYKDCDYVDKLVAKNDKGIFLGCFTSSRAYRVYNKRSCTLMETIIVAIDEVPLVPNDLFFLAEKEQILEAFKDGTVEDVEISSSSNDESEESENTVSHSGIDVIIAIPTAHKTGKRQVEKDHFTTDVIGDVRDNIQTWSKAKRAVSNFVVLKFFLSVHIHLDMNNMACFGFMYTIELKNVKEALGDFYWNNVVPHDLNQLEKSNVLFLVLRPKDKNVIEL